MATRIRHTASLFRLRAHSAPNAARVVASFRHACLRSLNFSPTVRVVLSIPPPPPPPPLQAGGSPRVLGDEERMLDLESGDPSFPLVNGNS